MIADCTQILALISADPRLSELCRDQIVRTPYAAVFGMNRMLSFDPLPLIDSLVEPHGWYRSRLVELPDRTREIYLEAVEQPVVEVSQRLYHATPRKNRDAITAQGLAQTSQGTTWMKRRYKPARVHFATSLTDALTFIESSVTERAAPNGPTKVGLKQLAEWDVYEFTVENESFHSDVEFGSAVWTADTVAASRLRRLEPEELPGQA